MTTKEAVDYINSTLVPISKIKDVLGVGDRMVWVHISKGIPHYKVCGRIMFDVKEVETWRHKRTRA